MKIIALQASPLSPFLESELRSRFEVQRWSDIADKPAWLNSRGVDVRVVVTAANVGVSKELMHQLPALALVAIFGVGFDRVDVAEARHCGIRVTNTPDVLTDDVADLALLLTLALLRNLPAADAHVRSGAWASGGDLPLGRKVTGRHFGIVGLGRIGKAIAARVAPLGTVSYTGSREQPVDYAFYPSVIELARACDVMIVATNATESNRHLIGRAVLDALGPDGYIVNIARGSLVDEQELTAALIEKRIAGAALDVFENEPTVSGPLRSLPNVVLTPHIGSATFETREAMAQLVLANLDAFIAGTELPTAVA
jgi:lactate dehydrogenase-like 2-hydroxyacid dehydrogenase